MQKQKQSLKISVITPSFNSGIYIKRAIESVLRQGYKNFEHIIIDGGSTDDTLKILRSYKHIKWVSEPDDGQTYAINKGFRMSVGGIIVNLNADDYFLPGAFSATVEEFNKGADFVMGNVLIKSSRLGDEFLNTPRITLEGMLRHWEPNAFCHNPVGYFYRRKVQELCPLNPTNQVSMDLEFLLEAASKFRFKKVERTLGCFQDGTETTTGKTQTKLDYWRPANFPYVDKYLEIFSEEERIKFLNDRRVGYAMMQAHMNRLNQQSLKSVSAKELPLVSIIIPTYNCFYYICRAVDSVLSQGLKNIEVIIVDDASTDDTQELLDERYGKNSSVNIILHPKNKKLGASRNTGLDNAKGKYVFFLDADDWVEEGSLVRLASISEKYGAEIVACGIDKVWDNGKSEKYHAEAFSCKGEREALYHLADYRIASIVWNKLYLREFIEKNNLRFIVPYWHEDVMFTTNAVFLCEKYISISDSYCRYFQRDSSIVNSRPTELHLRSYIKLYADMIAFIERVGLCKDKEGERLSRLLLKAHCSNDIFPNLLNYIQTRTIAEWEQDCWNACREVLGVKGYAVADFMIEAMKNIKFNGINENKVVGGRPIGQLRLNTFIKTHFNSVIHSRLRRPLMKIYSFLRLDKIE